MKENENNLSGYLFCYFAGNSPEEEQLFYALSRDGMNFHKLGDKPVFVSTLGKKSLRDPYIFRGEDGAFYVVATDMRCVDGWASQSSIVIYKTADLIHMDNGVLVEYRNYPGFEDCDRAWAPQAIWCPEKRAYMIYLALQKKSTAESKGITMFRQYARDLMDISTYGGPELMVDYDNCRGCAIDGDIIFDSVNGRYVMFFNGRMIAEAPTLTEKFVYRGEEVPFLTDRGEYMKVEGSNIYKLIGEDRWIIDADGTPFNGHRYAVAETSDFKNYRELSKSEYSFDFQPRHGYVIRLTDEEYRTVEREFGRLYN